MNTAYHYYNNKYNTYFLFSNQAKMTARNKTNGRQEKLVHAINNQHKFNSNVTADIT